MIKTSQSIGALVLAIVALSNSQAQDGPISRLPETTATAFEGALAEEAPVGVTGRPEWTNARRFPGTRVYLQQDPWEVGVGSWWRVKNHRDGTLSHRLLEEVEIGLPYRMQLDLYNDIEGDERGRFHYQSFNVELRWALADWGVLWGNPTLYGEYKFADHDRGSDVYEFKVLFGDQLTNRLHWGVNFVWEAETGGDREQELQVTGGLSYTLVDQRLSVGVEFLYDRATSKGERGDASNSFNIGPSIQYRVTDHLHVDASCMFGTNQDSDRQIGFLVIGYDFGGPAGHSKGFQRSGKNEVTPPGSGERYTPISGRHN